MRKKINMILKVKFEPIRLMCQKMLNNILIVTSTYIEIDKETNCKQKES